MGEAIAKPCLAERHNPCGSMGFGLLPRRKDCGAPIFAIASGFSFFMAGGGQARASASSFSKENASPPRRKKRVICPRNSR